MDKHDLVVNMQVQLPCGCILSGTHSIDSRSLSAFPSNDYTRASAEARDALRKQVLEHSCHAVPEAPKLELVPMTDRPAMAPEGRTTLRMT